MLESGPSELMIQEAPLPREGVSTSPERVEAAERDVRRSRELRESRTDQEHRDKEDGIRGLDEAFAIQNVREAQGAGKPPESSADRIKIAEYGNLANLAYVDFASGPDGSPKAT
ncbi:MAG: hypothetical protein QG650_989 [Patescibacteria group bacterium]|nr:hypothetical protein [Patescibacteria group bacterium]